MVATTRLHVLGLGTGDITRDRSGVELNIVIGDSSRVRLCGTRSTMEQLAMALQSLLAKLDQLNPKSAMVGETMDVLPVEATSLLVGATDDGRIGVRFESKGMAPTVVMAPRLAHELCDLVRQQLAKGQSPALGKGH